MRRPVPTYGKAFPHTWGSRKDRKRGGGAGGNEGGRGEKKERECTFFKERERRTCCLNNTQGTNKVCCRSATAYRFFLVFPRRAAP